MKVFVIATLALALGVPMAHAQTPAASKAKAKTSKPAPKKAPAKVAKAGKTPAKRSAAAAAPAVSVAALTAAQLAIAQQVHTGQINCELGAHVTVSADEKNPGYFHVAAAKQRYHMHPVESRTGAIRMEDASAGAMWLQLGNKSMLLNQKLGQRVADECAAPSQLEFAARMKAEPVADLLGVARN